jgi:hypothetical protein
VHALDVTYTTFTQSIVIFLNILLKCICISGEEEERITCCGVAPEDRYATLYQKCTLLYKAISYFFLHFASVQNCKTYPPAREKTNKLKRNKTKLSLHVVWTSNLSVKEILNKGIKQKIMTRHY